MKDDEIRNLVAELDTKDNDARDAAWQQLRELGEHVLPFFEAFFPRAKCLEARRDMTFHSIRYARSNDTAYRIGLLAIKDRSGIVRYRGCCVLAYSLRRDALPPLRELLTHTDGKTVEDAKAAIDAIQQGNHHYFIDRDHQGRTFWDVNPGDSLRSN